MPLRLCSILGTFAIALSLTVPALAENGKSTKGDVTSSDDSASAKKSKKDGSRGSKKKKKKGADKDEEAESASSDDKSDKDESKDGDKKGEDEAAAAAPAEEATPEPDSWERPPEEKEAPPPVAPAKETEIVEGDGRAVSMGLLLGYGFKTDRRARYFAGDPYTLAAGLRGGYSFDFQLYVGAYFLYYIGSGTTGDSAFVSDPTRTIHVNYMHFGLEAGYDLWVGPVILRPSLQVGPAIAFTDDPVAAQTAFGELMFGPGATLMVPMEEFFLGGDLRASIVTGDGVSNVLLAATGGLRF